MFWQAGRNFATGAPLYHDSLPGARPLKYPPFAAMVFTPLALFPLQVAAILMSLLNLGLWVVAVGLTRQIVARTLPDRTPSPVPLVLAVILSAQFFLDNFHHVQMNEVTFVLALLGIKAYLDGRDVTSAAAFVAATALKITPIFFAAWLVIRGRRRAALAVFPIALACLLVPMVLRGPSRGVDELAGVLPQVSPAASARGDRVVHGGTEHRRRGEPDDARARVSGPAFLPVGAGHQAGGAARLPRRCGSPCCSCFWAGWCSCACAGRRSTPTSWP